VKNAREEFEAARYEKDPELIARMLLAGRECLMEVQNRVREKHEKVVEHVDKSRTDAQNSGRSSGSGTSRR